MANLAEPAKRENIDSPGARERIVQSAIKLFCEKGYDGTPVREIVEAAGVTKPVLYYYFKNKDALLTWILEDSLSSFITRLEEAANFSDNLYECLGKIAELYLDYARQSPNLVRFINAIAFSGVYDEQYDFCELEEKTFATIGGPIKRAQERGEVRPDVEVRAMAAHFTGMMRMVVDGMVYMTETMIGKPLEENVLKIFLEGITPRTVGEGGKKS